MSDTVKLIIEIPKELYEMCKKYESYTCDSETLAIAHGIPLDDVKAEIKELTKAHCIQVMDREDIPLLALDIIEKYKEGSE